MRTGKIWTKEEDERLKALTIEGIKDEEISKMIGRTLSAIKSRRAHFRAAISDSKKNRDEAEAAMSNGLDMEIEPLKKGQDYVLSARGTGMLTKQESSRKIGTFKGKTDALLVFEYKNYSESYMKVDVALGEIKIREATKTDYQIIQ